MRITWLGHSSVMMESGGKTVFFDPYVMPKKKVKADYVFVTHSHFDHCANVDKLLKPGSKVFATKDCAGRVPPGFTEVYPGFGSKDGFLEVRCVQAYNLGKEFHPKGFGVGFLISLEGKKVYVAGDTDFIPEMKGLKGVSVAFLPVGGVYTMGLDEAGEAADAFKPDILIPYHYNYLENLKVDDVERLKELVKSSKVVVLKPGENLTA